MEPVTHVLKKGPLNTSGGAVWTEVLLETGGAGRKARGDGRTAEVVWGRGSRKLHPCSLSPPTQVLSGN